MATPMVHVVQDNTNTAVRLVTERTATAIRETTFEIEADAKQAAPVDTGFLRNSIHGEFDGKQGVVSVGAEYGAPVEFGTATRAATPYFYPAVRRAQQRLHARLRRGGR